MPHSRLPPPTPERLRRTLKGDFAIIAVCAVGLLCIGGSCLRERAFLAAAVHAEGTVTDIDRSKDEDGHTSSFPVVSFTDRAEKKWTFRSRKVDSGVYVGEKIPVVYDPDDPAEAHIDSGWVSWGTLTLVTLLDLGFLIPTVRDARRTLLALRGLEAGGQPPPAPADP